MNYVILKYFYGILVNIVFYAWFSHVGLFTLALIMVASLKTIIKDL